VSATITNPDTGSTTLSNAFTYTAGPTISAISPASGPTTGGTTVIIKGSGFQSGAVVTFGALFAASIVVNGSAQIQAVTPVQSTGAVSVRVTNPDGGTVTLGSAFTYVAPGAPTVTGVSPNTGAGGITVAISGSNFEADAAVKFGSSSSPSVTWVSSSQLDAVVPAGAIGTSVDVTVTNPDPGSATLPAAFTYRQGAGLLTGCTVNASNQPNCAIPSGWSLVLADGFESGSLGSAAESTGFAGNSEAINTAQPHTGIHSLDASITHNFAGEGLQIAGNSINSREVYLSYWMYVSNSNPGYGYDYTNWYHAVRVPQGQSVGFGIDMDFLPSSPPNCWFACVGGSAAIFGNISGYGWGEYQNWFNQTPGQWYQFEFHIKANDPGATNGDLEYYVNGVLEGQCNAANGCPGNGGATPGNMVQNADYSTANLFVGGDWGANIWYANAGHTVCSTQGDLGYGAVTTNLAACQCANQCPPNGNIPYFHIYYDDVVVLKK
jgi:hypothetical protein